MLELWKIEIKCLASNEHTVCNILDILVDILNANIIGLFVSRSLEKLSS